MTPARTGPARLLVVVGPGGVGKTTLASGLAIRAARDGARTLVITFDPSRRLAALLGLDGSTATGPEAIPVDGVPGLFAALVDARAMFDRVVDAHAPDAAAKSRVLENRYYDRLAGRLAGVFEYMAVERMFELQAHGAWDRIVLDTPPARNALDLLLAPDRIVAFVSSGIARFAARDWFDESGRLRGGPLGRRAEALLESTIGLDLVRDVIEFFSAFRPLFQGFRERAESVRALLRDESSSFLLVTGPTAAHVPEAMQFARTLNEESLRLAGIVVNRVHPAPSTRDAAGAEPHSAIGLLAALAARDAAGAAELRTLLSRAAPVITVAMSESEPLDPDGLAAVAAPLVDGWDALG